MERNNPEINVEGREVKYTQWHEMVSRTYKSTLIYIFLARMRFNTFMQINFLKIPVFLFIIC